MAQFVKVPPQRLEANVLQALLEEYASRDGTDNGERELSLEQKLGGSIKIINGVSRVTGLPENGRGT